MELKFYSGFKKRVNSTKQPSTATTTLTGELKESCSIESPVISIESSTNPSAYVYAYIPEFGRYYFVSDWVFNLGLWECHLSEDYLASFKTEIGNTTAYIERCAGTYNGDIVDTKYITKTNFQNNRVFLTSDLYQPSNAHGAYVIGVVNGDSALISQLGGSVTYYVLEDYQCRALMAYLLSTNFLSDAGFPSVQSIAQQLSQDTAKAFINPFNFIVSCVWYPFPVSTLASGNDVQIRVGYWAVQTSIATGKYLTALAPEFSVSGNLSAHPQAETRGNYLNFAPYSRVSLTIPPFGTFPLDLSYRTNGNHINGKIHLDTITGKAQLMIYLNDGGQIVPSDDTPVYEATAVIGVPIQLSQISVDYISALPHIGEAAASAVSGAISGFVTGGGVVGAVTGAIGAALPSVANAISCLSPQMTSKGVDGSIMYIFIPARINQQFALLVDEDNEEMGRPLMEKKKINTLSGYIKCFEASIDYACFDTEKTEIFNYLMSGFFYE